MLDPYTSGYTPGRRVALYSHDTVGLGHTRRNLLIAEVLAQAPFSADVLLVTGSRTASHFPMPTGVDCVTLPALSKNAAGEYGAKTLDLPLGELTRLRNTLIRSALEAFAPDVFIVDKVPAGALGELTNVLPALKTRGIKVVLGVRDILDDPESVRTDWATSQNVQLIDEVYDEVWVYGDSDVYDVAKAGAFPPALSKRLHYVGYLNPRERGVTRPRSTPEPFSLCLVGGGQDGAALAETFARARYPKGQRGILVTGPHMPKETKNRLFDIAAARDDLSVHGFLPEPTTLLREAAQVVTMGGYNTVTEVLAWGKPALIVPRTTPRTEQLIRAKRFARLNLCDLLHPDALTPAALGAWLSRPKDHLAPSSLPLNGLHNLVKRLSETFFILPEEVSYALATD